MAIETPPGTRLILVSDDFMEKAFTRTNEGYALRFEWGEQRPEGWYEPTIITTNDGKVLIDRQELLEYINLTIKDLADAIVEGLRY